MSHAVFPSFTGYHVYLSLPLWLTPQPRFEYGRSCYDYSTASFESVCYSKLRRNPFYDSYHIKVIIEGCILWRASNNSTENGIAKWWARCFGFVYVKSFFPVFCIGYLCKQVIGGLIHVWYLETLLVWQKMAEFCDGRYRVSHGFIEVYFSRFRLHLIPDERRYLQSKQKKKTCNPYFDETFVFQVGNQRISLLQNKVYCMDQLIYSSKIK